MAPQMLAAQTILPPIGPDSATKPPAGIDVWFDQSSYQTFDKATVYFNAEPGSYVVVVRVTPRGNLEVLYPRSPDAQTPYRPSSEARTALPFRNDGIEGIGEISAMASATPFDFSKVSDGKKWNGKRLSHPRQGLGGSLAGGFFEDISGVAGSRYGLASATYGVGRPGVNSIAANVGNPTAEEALRAMTQLCRSQVSSGTPDNDPSCVSAYMQRTDPKPRLGGPGRATTTTSPPPPTSLPPAREN